MTAGKAQAPASIQRTAHVRRIHRTVIDIPDESFRRPQGPSVRCGIDESVLCRLAARCVHLAHKAAAKQHRLRKETAHGDIDIEIRHLAEYDPETYLDRPVHRFLDQCPGQLAALRYMEIIPDERQSVVIQIAHDENLYNQKFLQISRPSLTAAAIRASTSPDVL